MDIARWRISAFALPLGIGLGFGTGVRSDGPPLSDVFINHLHLLSLGTPPSGPHDYCAMMFKYTMGQTRSVFEIGKTCSRDATYDDGMNAMREPEITAVFERLGRLVAATRQKVGYQTTWGPANSLTARPIDT